MTNDELYYILDAIRQTTKMAKDWVKDYRYDNYTNEFHHYKFSEKKNYDYSYWFKLSF